MIDIYTLSQDDICAIKNLNTFFARLDLPQSVTAYWSFASLFATAAEVTSLTVDANASVAGNASLYCLSGYKGPNNNLYPSVAAGPGVDLTSGTQGTASLYTASHVNNTDMTGTIKIVTGPSPIANAVLATITPSIVGLQTNFRVFLRPQNQAAVAATYSSTGVLTQCNRATSSTGQGNWTISSGSVALAASTTFYWDYFVTH